MAVVNTVVESSKDLGICGEFPITINTAIVSPMARPMPRITPVRIPGLAAGNSTLQIVCHLVAPRANDASSNRTGKARIESSDMDRIIGSWRYQMADYLESAVARCKARD